MLIKYDDQRFRGFEVVLDDTIVYIWDPKRTKPNQLKEQNHHIITSLHNKNTLIGNDLI